MHLSSSHRTVQCIQHVPGSSITDGRNSARRAVAQPARSCLPRRCRCAYARCAHSPFQTFSPATAPLSAVDVMEEVVSDAEEEAGSSAKKKGKQRKEGKKRKAPGTT